MAYITCRLGTSALLLVAVSMLAFTFLDLAPGEFVDDMRADPQVSAQTIAAMRARYGLDASLPARYARWAADAVRGDLGFSFAYQMPVTALVWERAKNTLALTLPAVAIAWAVALPFGLWSASRQGRWASRASDAATSVLLSVPELLVTLLFLLFALRTGWFPSGGMASPGGDELEFAARTGDVVIHAVLPVTALVIGLLPMLIRHVSASAAESYGTPAVQAARGHGIGPWRLACRYVLPMSAAPLVSLAGLSIATLLSASLLTEVVMSWPGLGPLLVEAMLARDLHVIVAASLLSTVLVITGNLLADVALYAVDPRIRERAW